MKMMAQLRKGCRYEEEIALQELSNNVEKDASTAQMTVEDFIIETKKNNPQYESVWIE